MVRASYPGRARRSSRDRCRTARAGDQWRRGHALPVVAGDRGRHDDADRHVQARHRPRQGAGAGAEPRGAGAAEAPRRRAPPRRAHAEELARSHDGGASLLARGALRPGVPRELRAPSGARLARAHPRRGAGGDLGRGRVRHARVARSRAGRVARAHRLRRRARDPRAERAGRRRRARPDAGAAGAGPAALDQRERKARGRGGVRRDRDQDRRERPGDAPEGRRPHRARRRAVRAPEPPRQPAGGRDRHLSGAGLERARALRPRARDHGRTQGRLPRGRGLPHRLRPHAVRARVDPRGSEDAARGGGAGRDRRDPVPADVARLDHPAARRTGVDRRDVRRAARARLLDQRALALRARARDRHRGGRRNRRGRERRASHPQRPRPARGNQARHDRGDAPDHRDDARAVRGVHTDRVRERALGPVLQAVRRDDRDLDRDLLDQLAHPEPGALGRAAAPARRTQGPPHAPPGPLPRLALRAVQPLVRALVRGLRERGREAPARLGDRACGVRRADRPHLARLREGALRVSAAAGQAVSGRVRAAPGRGGARPHRRGHTAHERDRDEHARRAERGRVPRALDQRLHHEARAPGSCS